MLHLITGKPGHGKSLFTIKKVLDEFVEGVDKGTGEVFKRPVYYFNIPALKLDWIELANPELWYECPPGSVIFIDECQKIFPNRHSSSAVPHKVSEFETHRHKGFDIFLLTQDPKLVDFAVRALVGEHYHLKRPLGAEFATINFWEECQANPSHFYAKRDAAKKLRFRFPKEIYGVYHSADVHTHKNKTPWLKLALMFGGVVLVPFLIWLAFDLLSGIGGNDTSTGVDLSKASLGAVSPMNVSSAGSAQLTNDQYLKQFIPRFSSIPNSAPIFDEMKFAPVRMPIIKGCMEIKTPKKHICQCSSQQGTRIPLTILECQRIMEDGFFDAYSEKPLKERHTFYGSLRSGGLNMTTAKQIKVNEQEEAAF